MSTQLKTPLTTLGLALASGLSAIAFSTPAYSVNVNLSTFDAIGDVTNNNTVIQSGTSSTVETGGGTGSLEEFLGIEPTDLNNAIADAYYGSAIKQIFSFNAGDQFSFNWSFNTSDSDQAFVSIGNAIQVLSTGSSYNYTFGASGNYQVAIGVVDLFDSTGPSTLTLSTAPAAVPEPLTILGAATAAAFGAAFKRRKSQG